MTYFFILGNNPTLSIAEILRVLSDRVEIKKMSEEALILEADRETDAALIQEQLGGTIKIGRIIPLREPEELIDLFPKNFGKVYPVKSCEAGAAKPQFNRVNFGFSIYALSPQVSCAGFDKQIKSLALKIKKALKQKGVSSRWVTGRERALSSVIVQKNKLLERGAEFVLLADEKEIWFGQTLTSQAFGEYSFRDWGRPARPIEKGMMPPKLAKIMINLARIPFDGTILDPFCGSGTVLQEAALLGYQIIGSDIDQEAIENTKSNLEWLATELKNKNEKIKNAIKNFKIFKCDIGDLSQKLSENSVDAIVAEPYLGPLRIINLELEIRNLSELYSASFQEFRKILKPNGRVVIIFPVFKIKNKLYFLPILDKVKALGWGTVSPIPDYLLSSPVIKITSRGSIIYSRPDQKVLREIFIFEKHDKI